MIQQIAQKTKISKIVKVNLNKSKYRKIENKQGKNRGKCGEQKQLGIQNFLSSHFIAFNNYIV